MALAEVDRSSPIDALFVSALDEMIDLHTKPVVVGAQCQTPLALAFSAVILLIRDLDQPAQGWLRVSQRPMLELMQKMDASAETLVDSSRALP